MGNTCKRFDDNALGKSNDPPAYSSTDLLYHNGIPIPSYTNAICKHTRKFQTCTSKVACKYDYYFERIDRIIIDNQSYMIHLFMPMDYKKNRGEISISVSVENIITKRTKNGKGELVTPRVCPQYNTCHHDTMSKKNKNYCSECQKRIHRGKCTHVHDTEMIGYCRTCTRALELAWCMDRVPFVALTIVQPRTCNWMHHTDDVNKYGYCRECAVKYIVDKKLEDLVALSINLIDYRNAVRIIDEKAKNKKIEIEKKERLDRIAYEHDIHKRNTNIGKRNVYESESSSFDSSDYHK
jgi:hypothetical protein